MVFQSNGLRDAFEGQGEAGFMVWTYASYDPLATILRPRSPGLRRVTLLQ